MTKRALLIAAAFILILVIAYNGFVNGAHAATPDTRPQPDFRWEQWPLPHSTLSTKSKAQSMAVSRHWVRAAYIIPSNRTAQSNSVEKMRHVVLMAHDWYKDQMERNGFGQKTFRYETEADGVTPLIHVISVPQLDSYFLTDTYNRVSQVAMNAGLSVGTAGEVWIMVYEGHGMNSDGTITNTYATGGTNGSGSDEGRSVVTANTLALMSDADIMDQRPFSGMIIPAIGPYPLVPDVSVAWYDGTTISQLSSVMHGVMIHEFSHALGLGHDYRNDSINNGDMMGFGLRGFRGWMHPELFSTDYSRLSYGAALDLNNSRYFNPEQTYTDNQKPTIIPQTTGTVTPVNGCLQITFTASDSASQLTMAWLQHGYDLVAEMPLSGYYTAATFTTPYFNPGQSNQYIITVMDAQGNRYVYVYSLTVPTGYNRAPIPYIKASLAAVTVGHNIVFDASWSSDPDNSLSQLKVEWDLNNDGLYDTAPSYTKQLTTCFNQVGMRMIRARLTDPSGAIGISAPLAIRSLDYIDPNLIWVDFSHIGTESGSQWNPYNSVAEGIFAVNSGGTVRILSGGQYNESLRITKPMRIEASGGLVRIGTSGQ